MLRSIGDHALHLFQFGAYKIPSALKEACKRPGCPELADEDYCYSCSTLIEPPITVVCGPPGSGKTTYVMQKMRYGDLIVDLDRIWEAISLQPIHEKPDGLIHYVLAIREALYESIKTSRDEGHVWIITCAALRKDRERLLQRFRNAELVILDTEPLQCELNVAEDPLRSDKIDECRDLIARWWRDFRMGQ